MKQTQKVTTRFPIESDLGADNIKRLSDLINEVYDDAESGMWKREGTRTDPAEVERLLRAHALILAEIDGVLVGSVNVNLMRDGVAKFGMLAADLNHRGKGIGSALVDRAENWARDMACHTMRLELLTPRNWTHLSKEFLKKWYSRIGISRRQLTPSRYCIRSWSPSWQRSATSPCGTSPWPDQDVCHAATQQIAPADAGASRLVNRSFSAPKEC